MGKYYYDDFDREQDEIDRALKITGYAWAAAAGIGICVLVGSYILCHSNHSLKSEQDSIETTIEVKPTPTVYVNPSTGDKIYIFPDGYTLTQDENGEYVYTKTITEESNPKVKGKK